MASVPSAPRRPVLAGLAAALAGPPIYAVVIGPSFVDAGTSDVIGSAIGMCVMWILSAVVIAIVLRLEGRPLASIGWIRLSRIQTAQAVAIGLGLSLAVPLLSLVVGKAIPSGDAGSIASAARLPWGLLLAASLTAATTEELLFRGYGLERLGELLANRFLGSVIAVSSFTITHSVGWNLAHVVGVVLPLGIALTVLYWWRRSLAFVMIVHFMIDLPLVIMSAVS